MNMHSKGTKQVQVCELCGKVEGQHLKPTDFYVDSPSLVLRDYDDNAIKVSMSLHIEDYNGSDKTQDKLANIVDSYMTQQEPPAEQSQLNQTIHQLLEFEQVQVMDTEVGTRLCKVCFNGLIKMLTKYGKFDKVVEF